MNIAILGASSQIAKDFIRMVSVHSDCNLTLFARRPEVVNRWLQCEGLSNRYLAISLEEFNENQNFNALINFIGVGNPAQAVEMGASIFEITLKYDDLALGYLQNHSSCKYIFLSSGAAYGANFEKPVDEKSMAIIPLNNFQPQDWYSLAKLHAECRHRSLQDHSIIDVRIFNYFSHTQDMSARFLITDIVRAIKSNNLFETSADNIFRDFINPSDFYQIIRVLLSSPPTNTAVDCYSKAPIGKLELLNALKNKFGLRYSYAKKNKAINATGQKYFYYSLERSAERFGYAPQLTSLEGLIQEISLYLDSAEFVNSGD